MTTQTVMQHAGVKLKSLSYCLPFVVDCLLKIKSQIKKKNKKQTKIKKK